LRQGYSPLQLRQMLFLHQSQPCEASNGTLHQPPPTDAFRFKLGALGGAMLRFGHIHSFSNRI
jgi:hypothetical protein